MPVYAMGLVISLSPVETPQSQCIDTLDEWFRTE